jgi:DNA-binding HxlR family transcriptional regulator
MTFFMGISFLSPLQCRYAYYDTGVKNDSFCKLVSLEILMPRAAKHVSCPVETTLAVIHGRWKVLVIYYLQGGVMRFGQLHRALPGISHRTLTKQLRELEAARLVRRRVYPEVPPKVEYTLTPLGESLKPVLMAMDGWGRRYASQVAVAR